VKISHVPKRVSLKKRKYVGGQSTGQSIFAEVEVLLFAGGLKPESSN
jgi:hypothetical protein